MAAQEMEAGAIRETCSHNCSACGSDCADRTGPQSLLVQPNAAFHIQKVIGVASGKGGVGKSLVISLLIHLWSRCVTKEK